MSYIKVANVNAPLTESLIVLTYVISHLGSGKSGRKKTKRCVRNTRLTLWVHDVNVVSSRQISRRWILVARRINLQGIDDSRSGTLSIPYYRQAFLAPQANTPLAWSYDYHIANLIPSYKASTNDEASRVSHLFRINRITSEHFPVKGFKIPPTPRDRSLLSTEVLEIFFLKKATFLKKKSRFNFSFS